MSQQPAWNMPRPFTAMKKLGMDEVIKDITKKSPESDRPFMDAWLHFVMVSFELACKLRSVLLCRNLMLHWPCAIAWNHRSNLRVHSESSVVKTGRINRSGNELQVRSQGFP